MPVYHVNFIFQATPSCASWTHSWYIDRPSHDEAYQEAQVLAGKYANAMPSSFQIKAIRVSDIEIRGDALLRSDLSWRGQSDLFGDSPFNGVGVRWTVGSGAFVNQTLKGLADDYVVRNFFSNLLFSASGRDAFKPVLDHIVEGDWAFKVQRQTTTAQRVIKDITALANNEGFQIVVDAFSPEVGQAVKIFGALSRSFPTLSGQQTVASVTTEGAIVINAPIPCDQTIYRGGLKIVRVEYEYVQPTSYQIRGVRSRKSGRPFDVPVGRSRNRIKGRLCLPVAKP